MNNSILRNSIIMVGFFLLSYLMGSFITLEFNILEWTEAGRALYVLGTSGALIILLPAPRV